ncbi:MAG: 4-hydroxybenzoate octaprenyltransferase [Methylophaga sp.]|nr:MAG: 4-hydroxybenzoate octaprenyltransferase [Methylophaga sp.]
MEFIMEKLTLYIRLIRLDKPIGILLLLWPTLIALWIAAEGLPDYTVLTVFVLGVILMRSAGCAINDYADREIDALVVRTMNRPLATGELAPKNALIVAGLLSLMAFLLAVFNLNKLTIYMSVVAVLLAAIYPFMKRYTYLPQIFLGAAFAWAIPMAFAAQTNAVPTVAWLLFLANILWTTAYDTLYAMADREEDMLADIKSTAILFGDDDKVIVGIIQFSFLLVMALVGSKLEMSYVFYIGIVVAALFSIYQQILVKNREPARCLHAFLNNNWVGAALFLGVVAHYSLNLSV